MNNLNHPLEKLLLHAAICGLTFITPGENLPQYIFEGTEEEKHNKIQMYYLSHKMWSMIAFVGRKN